mmetsp:Transcript_14588/g.27359  ORF Transcript_14588/g.27359 Transcript_14588/m.27359 type:complete len:81 (-) Transcript_14588:642-884(-)
MPGGPSCGRLLKKLGPSPMLGFKDVYIWEWLIRDRLPQKIAEWLPAIGKVVNQQPLWWNDGLYSSHVVLQALLACRQRGL